MDPIALRFAERLLAVLFGGMAIYLGYRLFLKVPERQIGEGKFTFPWDISVVLTRVGPGVFFALFGVAVVGTALVKGIEWQHARRAPSPGETHAHGGSPSATSVESLAFKGAGALLSAGEREARADRRALLRKEIAVLNNFTSYTSPDLPAHDRSVIERAITRIKLALMKPVWGDQSEGWGDVTRFEEWLKNREPDPPPADLKNAVEYYRYGKRGTP